MTPEQIVQTLGLQPHPEGGFFRELWRSPTAAGERSALTSIYFLLTDERPSHWHRVDAAEVWNYHAGAALELSIATAGSIDRHTLGADLIAGERPQATVPAHAWQSARTLGAWTLVGCAVGPGFEFASFELAPPDWSPPPPPEPRP